MAISVALHIIGVALWAVGLMLITRIFSMAHKEQRMNTAAPGLSRMFWSYVFPGSVITVLSGLHQLAALGVGLYMKQGWFHMKLTLVVLLIVATALFAVQLAVAKKGEAINPKIVGFAHGIASLTLVVGVILTVLGAGRFG